MVLNQEKCKFRTVEFQFLGYRINPEGILPSAAKQNAVETFRRPNNEGEVRSFLGLANYMGKFVPNLATMDEPLRNLIRKGSKFHWGDEEEKAFNQIKHSICNAKCLGFFKPEDETSVMADASPYALGAVLLQTNDANDTRVVCFASKSLTDTERRYCQTEKEALALVWSVERFQTFLIGREFNLLTDCKALTFLFSPTSRPCARIERWVLRLQGFQYKVLHVSGSLNIADVLSRLSTLPPKPFDEGEELMVREVAGAAVTAVALKWDDLENASREDSQIQEIFEALDTGSADEIPLEFRMIFSELCRLNDVLLRIDRIVVPQKLRTQVLDLAHEGHPGARVMKGHLRANVWWPKMDLHVERYVKACRGCSLVSSPSPPEPMMRKELPSKAWEQIAVDFLGPLPDGENLLVCVDYFSRFVEVVEMSSTSTAATVNELMIIFSRFGVPVSLKADNGPQFISDEFRLFCEEYGIRLVHSIPYWPQMNGEVERQNRSILKRLRIAQELGKDWRTELRKYMLMYHAANHSTTGKPPSELMFGRRIRTKLPCVVTAPQEFEVVREHDALQKEKGKQYADKKRKAQTCDIRVGDQVIAKRPRKENKLSSDFSPELFIVVRKSGADVTIRSSSTGKEYRRSSAHLKVIPTADHGGADSDKEASFELEKNDQKEVEGKPVSEGTESPVAGPSKRTRVEPRHLKDYIIH